MMDLHMHSKYSDDGEFTPEELVEQCAGAGISVMSITDHNCARANAVAAPLAETSGIRYIPGIEVDCTYKGVNFHVLGYGIDYRSRDFQEIEENVLKQEKKASCERLSKIRELGFQIDEAELRKLSEDVWTGEMFAEILLGKAEYVKHPLLLPYRAGGERSDNPYVNFYWDFCAQGKPCYGEVKYPSMAEAVDVIHHNGGKAVLAHPGINLKGHEDFLDEILDLALDGVEAFSSYHTPGQAQYYYEKATGRRMMVTCGSDYHGKTKPAIHLAGYPPLPAGGESCLQDSISSIYE